MDPSTFLGSVWGMIGRVKYLLSSVWIHRDYIIYRAKDHSSGINSFWLFIANCGQSLRQVFHRITSAESLILLKVYNGVQIGSSQSFPATLW